MERRIKKENQKVLFDIGQEVFDDPLTQEINRRARDQARETLEMQMWLHCSIRRQSYQ